MNAPVILLAPLASFVAVFLAVVALWPRPEAAQLRLRVNHYAPLNASARRNTSLPFTHRVMFPVLEHVGQLIARLAPPNMLQNSAERLERAGNPMTPGTFLALRALAAAGLPSLYVAAMISTDSTIGEMQLLVSLGLVVIGYLLPNRFVAAAIASRQRSIDHALPDALDLIVVSMEAGLGLDSALAKVVEKTHGPLADELRKVLSEIQLGEPRRDALRRIGPRTGVKDVITVFNAIVQADQMGVSMVPVMEVQADEARLKRSQRAEERAHQAGVKMTFPLILCILPSVLIVTVGPAAIMVYEQLILNIGRH